MVVLGKVEERVKIATRQGAVLLHTGEGPAQGAGPNPRLLEVRGSEVVKRIGFFVRYFATAPPGTVSGVGGRDFSVSVSGSSDVGWVGKSRGALGWGVGGCCISANI